MIGFNKSLNETNGQNNSTDTKGDKKEPKVAAVVGYGFVDVGGLKVVSEEWMTFQLGKKRILTDYPVS